MQTCPLCGGELGGFTEFSWVCRRCYDAYDRFEADLPEQWKKLTGGRIPTFEEWQEERLIQKALRDGMINEEEARRQSAEFAEKIRKKYNPTLEELDEWRRSLAVPPPSIYDVPPLF